jgi:hypothetical protein
MGNVIWIGEEVFGKTAVPGVAAELRLRAHRLPARQAVLAVTTRRVEPRHPDPVALLHNCHARSNGSDQTDRLMARNERECRLHRPVAVGRMEIGVADAAGLGFHQDLACSGRGNVPFLKL